MKLKILTLLALLIMLLGMTTRGNKKASAVAAPEQASTIEPTQRPQPLKEVWEYTSFSAEGLDSTRFELLKTHIQDSTFKKVDGIVVVKGGKILIEEYFNGYDQYKLHQIRSATKSIGSALMGIAIDQGHITSVQDKLYAYFQERKPFQNWDARKSEITLEHVLNMTTGLDCDDMDNSSKGNEDNVLQAPDIVRFMLDLPMVYDPGSHWAYSTGDGHLVGAVIESAAGMSVQEFAKTYLFEPLNITQFRWKTTGGIAHTGGGFWMLPIDMAKFGQLYLNKGRWHGRLILSEAWINESSKVHVKVTEDLGYGYEWWKWTFDIDGRPFHAFSAQGNGENHIFVFPDQELVIVLTGSAYGENYGPAQTAMMMNKYILPAVVQDVDPHRGEPELRVVPKALFALCAAVLISAFILWPVGFIVRRIRARRVSGSDEPRARRRLPVVARILASISSLIILPLMGFFIVDALPFELLLNSGTSHPLGIFEVFLGSTFITIVAVIVRVIMLLALTQLAFMALAHRDKWWRAWERWHYTAMTLAASYFVIVLLWWGFGRMPS